MLLQRLDARLGELKDWKTFSVAPKRIELIREMESLAGSELPRPELARRIKELQASWRTLARGAAEDLEAEGQRFGEAAARAFEPCREYFAQQAQVRHENLERREAMLEKLTAFAAEQDVETPNWRLIVQVLADARRQWRHHSPVDRAAAKGLQARFDALAGDLQGRLDAEYDRNIKAKRTLIERAERLPNEPDTRASIEQVKTLQRQWQAVGLVPRDEDNTLWTAFRQQCDAVFARRVQASAAYRAGLAANRARGHRLDEAAVCLGDLMGNPDAAAEATAAPASEAALRRLCIRPAVLADVPTTPEDQGFRRESQLQRLVHSIGQGVSAAPAQLDVLALEWIAAGPVEEEAYTRLLARFERCRDTRLRTDSRCR